MKNNKLEVLNMKEINKILVLVLSGVFLLGMVPNMSLNMNAKSETWIQNHTSELGLGESHFVEMDTGTLKLSKTLLEEWTVTGEDGADYLGMSVASAGDVNGDGYDDLIVGAYNEDTSGGKAYVFHGGENGFPTVWNAAQNDWNATGTSSGDEYGRCVASAGDINDDGYDDVMVSAPGYDSDKGRAYVYLGSAIGLSQTAFQYIHTSTPNSRVGWSIASAGDVNGDGFDDVIIGSPGLSNDKGQIKVWFGSLAGLSSSWQEYGESSGDHIGMCVASAGDVNGDGYDDIMASAPHYNSEKGRVYVWYGSPTGLSAEGADWFEDGENDDDYFGGFYSFNETAARSGGVASAGDVNGDGYDDVIIGAYLNDDGGLSSGKAYVYLGSSTGLSNSPSWKFVGEDESDYFGLSVASAGDVNNDGYDDIIASSHVNDDIGTNYGKVYLWHGSSSGPTMNPTWTRGGEASNDYYGCCVATAGDVNGDGYDEVFVGAFKNDDNGTDAGKAYVYSYGSPSPFTKEPQWTDLGESGSNAYGYSAKSAGDVNGDGYDDIIVGAPRNDDGGNEAGEAYVYHGSATGFSTTPQWSDQGEETYNYFGGSVDGAGDVNNDGYDDIIIGAEDYDGVGWKRGKVYVYHGSSGGLSSTPDWSYEGYDDYELGWSVASAGDINGDGYDDVIAGAPGYNDYKGIALIFHGSYSGLPSHRNTVLFGENSYDYFGYNVDSAGDVDDDGYDDILVGAPSYNDGDLKSNVGRAYVYHGSSQSIKTISGWNVTGKESGDGLGEYLSCAGDVDGDGYDDVIIGVTSSDEGVYNGGEAFVYQGSASGLSSSPDWSVQDKYAKGRFGGGISGAGDVNGDGYDDVIVGETFEGGLMVYETGGAYLYYGGSWGLSDTHSWIRHGEQIDDYFSISVSSAGDINADGYDDIIIGSSLNDEVDWDAGKVYVWHGSGYVQQGVYDSQILDIGSDDTTAPDWDTLSWNPANQPDGTRVRAQIATGNDTNLVNWRGPDGSSDTYYTSSAGQQIYNYDMGKYLRVRFYLESEFGHPDDDFGYGKSARTPTITDFTITYGTFQIPTVTLTWPNGGENLMHEETYDVLWQTTGDCAPSPVSLYYRMDGGSWMTIAEGVENNGTHLWTLPSTQNVEHALVMIEVTAPDGSKYYDVSDTTFSIDPPPLTTNDEQVDKEEEKDTKENKDTEKTSEIDISEDNLTKNTQNSKNQKTWSTTSLFVAISEGFVIVLILIIILVIKRKTKENNKDEKKEKK